MRLRAFGIIFSLALSILSAPLGAEAEPPGKGTRVGVLWPGASPLRPPRMEAFHRGLSELGYVEGENIVIEIRYAEGKVERLPELAAELVSLNVQVIATFGTLATIAVQQTTKTIPIVALADE